MGTCRVGHMSQVALRALGMVVTLTNYIIGFMMSSRGDVTFIQWHVLMAKMKGRGWGLRMFLYSR